MSIEIIGLITLAMGIASLIWFKTIKYDVFVTVTLLGSAAALVLSGVSIQPAHLLLGFYSFSTFSNKAEWSKALAAFRFPQPGFWLLTTAVYGAAGAFLFPRIFGGLTYVNAIGVSAWGLSPVPVPLGPTSGNMTQTIYFFGDIAAFLIAHVWSQSEEGRFAVARALLVYAIGNIVFAAADLATFWTGSGFLLDFIRNSSYTLHNETVVVGLKRIVGSFTEASAFAYASLGALGYTLSLWLDGIKSRLTFSLSIITMALLIFSTSSTAYGALPVFLLVFYMVAAARTVFGRVTRQTVAFVICGPLVVITAVLLIVQTPSLFDTVMNYANILVLNKASSQSALERGEWNASALRNFFETYGVGAGIGSVRASSFALAILANLGVLGSLTYSAFLAMVLLGRNPARLDVFTAAACRGAKWSCFALLIAGTMSGAMIDLGLPFCVMAGFICGVTDTQGLAVVAPKTRPLARPVAFAARSF